MTSSTSVVVIGAGHSGLSVSHHLSARSVDHVVIERGDVGQSWRSQRWDSLRLLTPNWMTRLPGHTYAGDDPDGFLAASEVVELVTGYARASAAPVWTGTSVTSVRSVNNGFEVSTSEGVVRSDSVVSAVGITRPAVPDLASAFPESVVSLTADRYRNPNELPEGGVLVVGASASGVQLAQEIHRSGRPVTLAVGEHVRVPRQYRNRDILWWLDAIGVLDERWDEVDDIVRVRHLPSMQLAGGDRTIDLNSLQAEGVRIVGKLAAVRDGLAQFSGSLKNVCALADLKLGRLLDTIDAWAGGSGERPEPTEVPASPLGLDLRGGEITSVVWATGIKPDFSWLEAPVFDHRGRLRHEGGVVDLPGLYAVGLPVLRRRRSSYIDGAARDAEELTAHLAGYLDGVATRRSRRAS